MTVTIGENNALTYSFNATAKTITVTGLELGNLTSIKNSTRGNAEMKPYLTDIAVSGSTYTLTFSEVPVSSADTDTLVLLMEVDGDFEDYDDTKALFHKSWSSQKIQSAISAGGSGASSLILTDTDDINWLVGVTTSGVLTTTETADAGVTSIIITATADDSQWILTVNTSGVLVTTEV